MTKSFNLPGLITGMVMGIFSVNALAEGYEEEGYVEDSYAEESYQEEVYQDEYVEESYQEQDTYEEPYADDNAYEQAAIDPEWEAEARAYCQEQAEYEAPEERAQFIKDCVDSQLQ